MGKLSGHRPRVHPIEGLCGNEQYRAVLSKGLRRSSNNFLLRAIANELGRPRLGIVVARKVARRSVDRNRGKRLLREFFRLTQDALCTLDIVVQIKGDLRNCSNASLRAELSILTKEFRSVAGLPDPQFKLSDRK